MGMAKFTDGSFRLDLTSNGTPWRIVRRPAEDQPDASFRREKAEHPEGSMAYLHN